ncbi:MAG: hypothetical protein A2808_00330 [Candidatus Moranbacteria bacterium RIFCSPHIGHO2_01_FULL_55_24]|nr:MAG: hypothetical protein A2808_00330 [Candidatus Moranbacteria bacterium RIFCSPHIGHO2_01_FULL_55_24]
MKILFISRAYPPITGGIENQNFAISEWLPKHAEVTTLANRHGKKALPWFLPFVLVRAIFLMPRFDVLLLGDGVLGIVGYAVKTIFPKKTVVSVVHGLDLTFKSALYQRWWVKTFLPTLDGYLAVSQETRLKAESVGLAPEKMIVIPNGIDETPLQGNFTRQDLETLLGENLEGKIVLLTSGRLAKRKGVAWFIREVLPALPENVLYVVAGDGPDRENVHSAMEASPRKSAIRTLGRITDADRNLLLHTADIFVQPNIPVPDDMEGFGIAVIEAALCERPVVASRLEGLKDAIQENENGILVAPENRGSYLEALIPLINDLEKRRALGEKAARYTREHFHWEKISRLYIDALEALMKRGTMKS